MLRAAQNVAVTADVLDPRHGFREDPQTMTADHDTGRPALEIAIAGQGVTPDEIPLRELLELLGAASQLIDAVAADATAHIAMTEVRCGSAAYEVRATQEEFDTSFEDVVERTYAAIERRGAGDPPDVRRALLRLHRAGANRGVVRVSGLTRRGQLAPMLTSAPLEIVPTMLGAVTILHGTIVGVDALRGRYVVRLRPEEGPKIELDADAAMAQRAGRAFNHTVRCVVRYQWNLGDDRGSGWELLDIDAWHREPLLDVLDEIRRDGVVFDRRAFLAEIARDSEDDV